MNAFLEGLMFPLRSRFLAWSIWLKSQKMLGEIILDERSFKFVRRRVNKDHQPASCD
jgi:hypothetical protein